MASEVYLYRLQIGDFVQPLKDVASKVAESALREKLGHRNGLYLVTDPSKHLILSTKHSTENLLVGGSTPIIVVNKGVKRQIKVDRFRLII